MNEITEWLIRIREIYVMKDTLLKEEEEIKNNIKIFLKERQWTDYLDSESKISVRLDSQQRQTVDMKQLKYVLNEKQLAAIMKTTTFEKMSIITPELKEKLSKFVRKASNTISIGG